jgi:endoglucanase
MRRNIGAALLIAAVAIVLFVLYQNSMKRNVPLVFAPKQLMEATWNSYKDSYIEEGSGRTLDRQRNDITTSEGQAYTMLRAAWMGDKETFDRSLKWTNQNLKHQDDALFAWLYGRRDNGTYGVLEEQGGRTSASDGDTDTALALLFAYSRWQDEAYLTQATDVINAIWEREVITINGTPYLTANDLEKDSDKSYVIVNPSYLSPYAYRIFAKADPSHPWNELVDSSYALIKKSAQARLDTQKSAGLPPDWLSVDKATGEIAQAPGLQTDFGYDAFRTYFRVALDWAWTKDPRAKEILESSTFLAAYMKENGKLPATFTHAGQAVQSAESPAMYGGVVGALKESDPKLGKEIYEQKLLYLYDPGENTWKQPLGYYDSNWVWFGIGLYNGLLPDLTGATATSTS